MHEIDAGPIFNGAEVFAGEAQGYVLLRTLMRAEWEGQEFSANTTFGGLFSVGSMS